MTNRIKIDTSTFKVSKPTYDVNNATGEQLLFDANNGYSYAGVLFAGVENSGTFDNFPVNPWTPWSGGSYDFSTSRRYIKTILFSQKGITRSFTVPPEVIFMVRKPGATQASPSYSYVQQTAWPGTSAEDWSGGAVWASVSLDGSGLGTLTLRVDRSDFATGMQYAFEISYIVFQNFTGLPQLTPV